MRRKGWGPVDVAFGSVLVTSQLGSFLRRRLVTGQVLGEEPLELPPRTLRTRAVWWTAPADVLAGAGVTAGDLPGALHAAEHAALGLLPLLATCDRWDVGGVSTALHPDTGLPTVVVHDAHPGGAGFAERGYAVMRSGCRRPATPSPPAVARPAARPACSRRSAAAATSRSTGPVPCGCSGSCWTTPNRTKQANEY